MKKLSAILLMLMLSLCISSTAFATQADANAATEAESSVISEDNVPESQTAEATDVVVLVAPEGMCGVSEVLALSRGMAVTVSPDYAAEHQRIHAATGPVIDGTDIAYYENGRKVTNTLVTLTRNGATSIYYFDETGAPYREGYLQVKNEDGTVDAYYFQQDGTAFNHGLLEFEHTNGKTYWFYFDKDGRALTNQVKATSSHSVADASCRPAAGDLYGTRRVYCFDEKGRAYHNGWQTVDGKTYYLNSDGTALTGKQTIDEIDAYFTDNGALTHKVDPKGKMVAITYDDGPSINTPTVLDVLEKNQAVATFFIVGERADTYASSIKRAYGLGCEIANHTTHHSYLTKLDADGIRKALKTTNDKIEKLTGETCKVMRPPGGLINDTVAANVGMPMILWDVDTRDWETRDAEQTIANIKSQVTDGSIILMHDLYSPTAEASKTIIPWLIENGYQLVTVSELAEYRGGAEAGQKYLSFPPVGE